MAMRKKYPFSLETKDYLNDTPRCYQITEDEWIIENEYEETNICGYCKSWKGMLIICPKCNKL